MYYKFKGKIKLVLIGIVVIILACIFSYFITDINNRFPEPSDVYQYTKDNPAMENGLEITPVNCTLYTVEEYKEEHPNDARLESMIDNERIRILEFRVRYTNTTDQALTYETNGYGYHAVAVKSGFNNGVSSTGQSKAVIEPNETQERVFSTRIIAGSLIDKKWIDKLDTDTYKLVYWWYPVRKELVFESVSI